MVLSDHITSIGSCAFMGCRSLETINIPESVSFIGRSAFSDCSSLTSITIPSNVEVIEYGAFKSCSKLESIEVDITNPYFESIDGVLMNKVNKSLVQYPAGRKDYRYTVPSNITSIILYAFYESKQLKSLIIPDSVTSIGQRAFCYCTGLTSVVLPSNLTLIQSYTFYFCSGLVSITIPPNVVSINEKAFACCDGLTSISIPSSVESIDNNAFFYCENLQSIVYLGNSDPYPMSGRQPPFDGCDSLKYICVPSDYRNSSFCGVYGVSLSKVVTTEEYNNMTNHCFEAVCLGNEIGQKQRMNASEWINRTNGCIAYECDNTTGRVSRNKCKDDMICFNDTECVGEDEMTNKTWTVVIEKK